MWLAADLTLLLVTVYSSRATEVRCSDPHRDAQAPCVFEASFPADRMSRFDLETHAGDVRIRADDTSEMVEVRATAPAWGPGCALDMGQDRERGYARVDAEHGRSAPCRLDFEVVVHRDTRLTVRVGKGDVVLGGLGTDATVDIGHGDLELHDITGSLDAEMGNGQLEGEFAGPRIHVEMGTGDVRLHELLAPVAVSLGMGNIELVYEEAPAGNIDARTGTGTVRIVLPSDTPVAANVQVGLGTKQVALPFTADAITRIDARSEVGKVAVVPR